MNRRVRVWQNATSELPYWAEEWRNGRRVRASAAGSVVGAVRALNLGRPR